NSSSGINSTNTRSCPSSTPTLNDKSEVSRCDTAHCIVCLSANENPNPCTSPNPSAIIHRRSTLLPTMFSSAMYTIDTAINVSIRGGHHHTQLDNVDAH